MNTLHDFLKKKRYCPIPLKKMRSNHLILMGKINHISGVFILDTGASYTCIDRGKGDNFGLAYQESTIRAAGVGTNDMAIHISEKTSVTFGVWQTKNLKIKLIDFSHIHQALQRVTTMEIDGIIGADILRRGKAVIDYSRKLLYLK